MTFIAIENMASAYGYKGKNTKNKPEKEFRNTGQKNAYERTKNALYENRRKLAEAVGFDPQKDPSEQNFLFHAQMFTTKRKDRIRHGICGSLNSMLKRIQFECTNTRNLKFDTLVFVGHGNAGLMTIGIGCTPDDKYAKQKQGKLKQTYEGLNIGDRLMHVKNQETWSEKFRAHKDCFKPDDQNTFHLFFAGCSTGNLYEGTFRHLTEVAAETLAPMLNCNVNAYGTDRTIENTEILFILENLDQIKSKAKGDKGSHPIGKDPESDDDINLDWVKRKP